ncbi:hypothetical protein CsatA_002790 [Cannabis sativa]
MSGALTMLISYQGSQIVFCLNLGSALRCRLVGLHTNLDDRQCKKSVTNSTPL